MLSTDANILKIKHEILYQVAKLAFEGKLEEKKEALPYELLPGPQAKYRCCVYKEREVVRQRIRLAEGKCPSETPKTGKDNVVQVIEAACADCPLSHYIVTDNCRKCMAKACQQACKFELCQWDVTELISTLISVRSVVSALRPVHIMP